MRPGYAAVSRRVVSYTDEICLSTTHKYQVNILSCSSDTDELIYRQNDKYINHTNNHSEI